MSNRSIKLIISILLLLNLISCSADKIPTTTTGCTNDMNAIFKIYGTPEEIDKIHTKGFYREKWWFWSRGVSYNFSQFTNEKCNVELETFKPFT